MLAVAAKYRAAHKAEEKLARAAHYQRNKARVKEIAETYRKANPHVYAAAHAKRVAAELKATPKWADMKMIAAFYREAAKLTKETGIPHEVDHAVPLQGRRVCGLHCEANLQILTRTANRSKINNYNDD